MKILTNSTLYTADNIKMIEQKMNATYVFESCLKNRAGGWANMPVAIFYTENAHPEGSHYFGVYTNFEGHTMITDGISATESFSGLEIDNEIIYSRYRHDFREHNGIFVDGGRDYMKCGGARIADANAVTLQVIDSRVVIAE